MILSLRWPEGIPGGNGGSIEGKIVSFAWAESSIELTHTLLSLPIPECSPPSEVTQDPSIIQKRKPATRSSHFNEENS